MSDDKKVSEKGCEKTESTDYKNGRLLDCGHVVYLKRKIIPTSGGELCIDCYCKLVD